MNRFDKIIKVILIVDILCAFGNPDNYGAKTRVEYLVNKVCGYELESTIKKVTEKLTKEVNAKVQEMVKLQLGDKIGGLIGIDDILKGKQS